jgi:putative ABC transport system ATP-binding protein
MDPYLKLSHISKTFEMNSPNAKTALVDFSMTLNRGDYVTILGSNGAGKSTLFNAILGSFPIDKGEIILEGMNITYQKNYRRAYYISCLFQNPLCNTSPNLTIEENLALAYARKAKKSFFALNRRDGEYFRDQLSRFGLGLENRLKTKMGLLSGGQRQAASLVMAMMSEPKLLLLDEHTASLDPLTANIVLKITDQLISEKNITTMMITHNMNYALAHGNRTIMMDSGSIILDISGKEREAMTPNGLIELFNNQEANILSDRMVLIPKT